METAEAPGEGGGKTDKLEHGLTMGSMLIQMYSWELTAVRPRFGINISLELIPETLAPHVKEKSGAAPFYLGFSQLRA